MRHLFGFSAGLLLAAPLFATLTVQLKPSLPSPQLLGTPVSFTATATDSNSGTLDYQFSVAVNSLPSQITQDYDISNVLVFAPYQMEATYTVSVVARNKTTLATATTSAAYVYNPRITGSNPAATATAHPLVALFSAPACAAGSSMFVRFSAGGATNYTSAKPCTPATTMNFYVAGMVATTNYSFNALVNNGTTTIAGPTVKFKTGPVGTNVNFPPITIITPANSQTCKTQTVLLLDLQSAAAANAAFVPTSIDLKGDITWYYAALADPAQQGTYFIRPLAGGDMLVILKDPNTLGNKGQIIREIDLAGNTVRQTSATRITEQLNLLGKVGITDFNHDAIRLANGHTIVNASQEEIFPTGTQGSTAPVDIIGNAILDLDENLQLVWSWSGYDHLDINRAAVLGETCANGSSGCPPVLLAPVANDWLHGNSINYIPSSGDLLYSMRNQDWVAKIDYNNGVGTGNVIWEMGHQGNFTISATGAFPWFSHQHDAEYELNGTSVLSIFDNGNTRVALSPGMVGNSRGQVLSVDEANFKVTLLLNVDLGVFAPAVGSAQLLDNGNYHFEAGSIDNAQPPAQAFEFLPDGTPNYHMGDKTGTYRSYRMDSLYQLDAPTH